MSIAITLVQYKKCQQWLVMSSIWPIPSIELPFLVGTKLQQLKLDTTILQKATMENNRVLDLQDNTTSNFPYQFFQLQNLHNHKQKVVNTTFTRPLSLFNFRDYTKIRKKVYIFPASFYLGWWKVMR
jgi:hypothetical protein